ncbi:TlpA family protein disulfide reductase [Enhygromyxa salina]|uniref:TlpA family protein disulfide reductase n=1 Tax=Enhygromyxa salina TaxID=215803 RepID=UPI0011BAD91A|nr:redoxin domain-containing protein [Enhygromyxa salina]
MTKEVVTRFSVSLGVVLVGAGCVAEDDGANPFGDGVDTYITYGTDSGDGDGDPSGDGDADTDPTGDGDPSTTDNGDGDSGPGDGDGEPTTGDGDGDPCNGDSPYMGGWDIGCCQNQVAPGGWQPGQIGPGTVVPDWTFNDQFGDAVRLYDFCHEAIYFEYVALWCGSCQAMAPAVAGLFNQYDAQGLMTLSYMSENGSGGPAAQADVVAWASQYGQDGLVVYSNHQDVWYPFGVSQGGNSWSISLPGTMLLEPGMKITKMGVPSNAEIQAALP